MAGVVAVAILGFGGWYAYDSGIFGAEDDAPPALSLGGAGFQGKSVDTTFGFLKFDAGDVSDFSEAGRSMASVEKGVNYFSLKKDADFAEILSGIKPFEDLQVLLVSYDKVEPWAGNATSGKPPVNGCFKVYPKGPYEKTCEQLENKLEDTKVFKGDAIAIISNKGYDYDSNILADAKTLGNTFNLTDKKGWSMHPISSTIDLNDPKIISIWAQKSQNDFEKITDLSQINESREYKMLWIKVGTPGAGSFSSSGGGDTAVDTANEPEQQSINTESVLESLKNANEAQNTNIESVLEDASIKQIPTDQESKITIDRRAQDTTDNTDSLLEAKEKLDMEQVLKDKADERAALLEAAEADKISREGAEAAAVAEATEATEAAAKAEDSILNVTPASAETEEKYFGFDNYPNPESRVLAFQIKPTQKSSITELNTSWKGCATPSNFTSVSRLYVNDTDLLAEDTNGDGNFQTSEFKTYAFDPDTNYSLHMTGNTSGCVLDELPLDTVEVNLDSISFKASGVEHVDKTENIKSSLIYECNDISKCKQKIEGSFNILFDNKDMKINAELESGDDTFGDGFNPSPKQIVLAFELVEANTAPINFIKMKYLGCFGKDSGVPLAIPTIITEKAYLNNDPEIIAEDKNQDGTFTTDEFADKVPGIESNVRYVIVMDTDQICTFNADNPDIGSVEFAKSSPSHGNVNEIIYGLK